MPLKALVRKPTGLMAAVSVDGRRTREKQFSETAYISVTI
jgi:hypothetical protein